MNKCVIFTGGELNDPEKLNKAVWQNAFVIAADSGYRYAEKLGIIPDLAIGDYDSLGYIPENCSEALKRGYDDITITGALGGRFDHTYSNIQSLGFILKNGASGRIISPDEEIVLILPGNYKIKKDNTRSLSLFAYTENVKGLNISGVKYPLKNAEITSFFPIGLSNVIIDDYALISFENGLLLMISSRL